MSKNQILIFINDGHCDTPLKEAPLRLSIVDKGHL